LFLSGDIQKWLKTFSVISFVKISRYVCYNRESFQALYASKELGIAMMMAKIKDAKFHKVGLAFSSDFSQLELAWVNTSTGDIIQAGNIPLTCINANTRIIEDEEALKESILALYDSLDVPRELHVTVILPSLYTRMIPFPSSLNDEEMAMALVSEAERSVLFKRNTPQVDWIKLNEIEAGTLQILLSSYPASEITTLMNCLESLKLPMVGIDTHLTSLVRGLHSTGAIAEDEQKRLLCVVSFTNFAILILEGTTIVSLIEVPLSTQGVDEEHILADIDQDLQGLGDVLFDCTQAIVVKNNPAVTAEGLAKSFARFSEVVLVEQSPETIASLGSEAPLYPCTVEVLGATLYQSLEQLPRFNFMPLEKQTLTYLKDARKKVLWAMIGLNAVAAIIVVAIVGVYLVFNAFKGNELANLEKDVQKYASVTVDQDKLVENIWINKNADLNQNLMVWLIDIQKTLPASSWFNKLDIAFAGGASSLTVEGGSQSPNDITLYRKNLKPSFSTAEMKSTIEPAVLTPSASKDATAATTPTATDSATSSAGLNYYAWSITSAPLGAAPDAAGATPAGATAVAPAATPPAGAPPPGA
jgi:hypothetical protein